MSSSGYVSFSFSLANYSFLLGCHTSKVFLEIYFSLNKIEFSIFVCHLRCGVITFSYYN